MHNSAPVLENNSHKLLWDFNIQTDHLIPVRRPGLIIINKKMRICKICTRITDLIFYDDNRYTKCASKALLSCIDFNDTSTPLGILHAKRLENRVH